MKSSDRPANIHIYVRPVHTHKCIYLVCMYILCGGRCSRESRLRVFQLRSSTPAGCSPPNVRTGLSLPFSLCLSLPPSLSFCPACGVVVLCIDLCVSDRADTVQMSHAGSDRLVLLDMLGLTLFLSVCPSLCRSRSLSLSLSASFSV